MLHRSSTLCIAWPELGVLCMHAAPQQWLTHRAAEAPGSQQTSAEAGCHCLTWGWGSGAAHNVVDPERLLKAGRHPERHGGHALAALEHFLADIRSWTLLMLADNPDARQRRFLTRLLYLVQVAGESPSPQKLDIERTASTSSNAPLLTPSQMSALSLASPKVNFALNAAGMIPGAVVYTGLLSGDSVLLFLAGVWLQIS